MSFKATKPPLPRHLNHISSYDIAHPPAHVAMSDPTDKKPVADQAEDDAWFPSPYSLTQYVPPKTDFDGADYPNAYTGGKWKVLLIAT